MAKYDPLRDYLTRCGEASLWLSFAEIERLIGDSLPASARRHPAWWGNEQGRTHIQARSWLDVGYETHGLDLNAARVEFVRSSTSTKAR
jgi:hypothetical protein